MEKKVDEGKDNIERVEYNRESVKKNMVKTKKEIR